MARKTLLSESEIRQFMKLANIKPLQEMGGYEHLGLYLCQGNPITAAAHAREILTQDLDAIFAPQEI